MADEVALATAAGFDALGVSTPWAPGQTEPDPSELVEPPERRRVERSGAASACSSRSTRTGRDAPLSDAEQEQFAAYTARWPGSSLPCATS